MRRTIDIVRLEQTLTEVFDDRYISVREQLHIDQCSDPFDEARLIEDAAVATEQLDTAWQHRRQAQAAFERLKAGRYGVCASCGREISEARLSAHPVAIRCLRCEQIYEAFRGNGENVDSKSIRKWLDTAPDAA